LLACLLLESPSDCVCLDAPAPLPAEEIHGETSVFPAACFEEETARGKTRCQKSHPLFFRLSSGRALLRERSEILARYRLNVLARDFIVSGDSFHTLHSFVSGGKERAMGKGSDDDKDVKESLKGNNEARGCFGSGSSCSTHCWPPFPRIDKKALSPPSIGIEKGFYFRDRGW